MSPSPKNTTAPTWPASRLSSELAQNERLYNVEATNNIHVNGKRVRGFIGIEVLAKMPFLKW